MDLGTQSRRDSRREFRKGVQQQNSRGAGALRKQLADHPCPHRQSSQDGLIRHVGQTSSSIIDDGVPADSIDQSEAVVDAGRRSAVKEVDCDGLVSGASPSLDRQMFDGTSAEDGVEERDVSHHDIMRHRFGVTHRARQWARAFRHASTNSAIVEGRSDRGVEVAVIARFHCASQPRKPSRFELPSPRVNRTSRPRVYTVVV